MNIKVAFVLSHSSNRSAQRQILLLLKYLEREKFTPLVCCLRGGELLAKYGRLCPTYAGFMNCKQGWLGLSRLIATLRAERPQICYCVGAGSASYWGCLAALMAGVPHRVISIYSLGRPDGSRVVPFRTRLMLPFVDMVVALSPRHRQYLQEVERVKKKIIVIPNGVDTQVFHPFGRETYNNSTRILRLSSDAPLIGYVATLRPWKGFRTMLEALSIIRNSIPNTFAVIAGRGERLSDIQVLAQEMGVDTSCLFVGEQENIRDLYRLFSISVLPYEAAYDVIPDVLLESMAMGIPVVATSVGSIPEIIEHDVTGILVPPQAPECLAQAILYLLRNPQRRKSIASAALCQVQEAFSMQVLVKRYEKLFGEIVDE